MYQKVVLYFGIYPTFIDFIRMTHNTHFVSF